MINIVINSKIISEIGIALIPKNSIVKIKKITVNKNENSVIIENILSFFWIINHCLPKTWETAVKGKTNPNNFKVFDASINSDPSKIIIILFENKKIIAKNSRPRLNINQKNLTVNFFDSYLLISLDKTNLG